MISAKVVLDAYSPSTETRITTLEVIMPKFLVAQINTHRKFCLAGDTELSFDLPSGKTKGVKRPHTMTISDFVNKWLHGNNRTNARPKDPKRDLSAINPTTLYTTSELAKLVGYAANYNLNKACKTGELKAFKQKMPPANQLTWMVNGKDFIDWYNTSNVGEHLRQDMQARLAKMHIRQLNEVTGEIQHSTVKDVTESGVKPVYTLTAGKYSVAGSLDHLIKTEHGYTRMGDLKVGDQIVVASRLKATKADPKNHKFVDGQWRSKWQDVKRTELIEQSPLCRECNVNEGTDIHHIIPVNQDTSLTYEPSNITLLCKSCHSEAHKVQGWQTGTPLVSKLETVTDIKYRGDEMTYDLEISGEFPNFLANNVVVHNSRNSASSRAIPTLTSIKNVLASPVSPKDYGLPKNGKGMQPKSALTGLKAWLSVAMWNSLMYLTIAHCYLLNKVGLHKQWTNRLLEPYTYTKVLITSTEWDNFMKLRRHHASQDAMQVVAECIHKALNDSTPTTVHDGYWYLPYVGIFTVKPSIELLNISVSCCAQVSFRTSDDSPEKAERVVNALLNTDVKHMSPFEHIAVTSSGNYYNLHNFMSYRYILENV